MNDDKPASSKNELSIRAALLAAARVIGFALALPLPLVLVRTLDQSEFGLYKQVFQILQTSLALLGLHVSLSAYYFMPRHPDKKPQVAMNVVIFYGAVGSAVAMLFAIYPRWITVLFKSDEMVPYMPLLGLAIMLWLVSSLLEVVTVANSDIRMAALFTVLVHLAKSGMLIAAGLIFKNVHAIVWAAVAQGVLQCLMLFFYLRSRFGKFWASFDGALFKTQLANAIPFGLGGLAYATQADMHNYFVSHYFAPADFAIYAVGCFELPLLSVLVDSVISVLLPEVARREARADFEGIITLWASAVRKLAFFFVPAYTFLFVVRYEFITALFTKNYEAAVAVFTINLLNILLFIAVPTSIIRAFEELKYFRLKLSIAMLPLSFVALYTGIHAAGLVGAVTALVVVQTIDLAIIVFKIGRRLNMSFGDIKRLAPVLKTAGAAAFAAVATYAVKAGLDDSLQGLMQRMGTPKLQVWATLAICGIVFAAVHLVVAFVMGAVTDEEKVELRGALYRVARRAA
ncbi:MAG TPA: oligosaccharide flippase family protein [Blastocatellia bacterium]|jgi:O-antigen/teichoic acid export membrane protein